MLFETQHQTHFLLYEYCKHLFSQLFLNHSFHIILNNDTRNFQPNGRLGCIYNVNTQKVANVHLQNSVQYLPYFVNVYNIYHFLCVYNINLHCTILPYNVKEENFNEVSHSLAIIKRKWRKLKDMDRPLETSVFTWIILWKTLVKSNTYM